MDKYSGNVSKHENDNHLVIYNCGSGGEEGTLAYVPQSGGASLCLHSQINHVIESFGPNFPSL